MVLEKLTGPTVAATPNNVVPSGASVVDETILAPKINQIIDELNALGAKVAALTPAPTPTTSGPTIPITSAQAVALRAIPTGGAFTLSATHADGSVESFGGRMDAP